MLSTTSPFAHQALRHAGFGALLLLAPLAAYAGPEIPGTAADVPAATARPAGKQYTEIRPDAVYARPEPAAITHVYGTRRYAGLEYMIVPGQWYPPVWEDPCTVKRTCVIPGVAPWPGVRVDLNSDIVPLAPIGPPPVPVRCAPAPPVLR